MEEQERECQRHPDVEQDDEDCPACVQEEFGYLLNHEGTY